MIDWFTEKALQKCCKKLCENCSDQFILFAKLDRIANPVMFTKKYDAIRAWLIDLQGLQILKVAKRGRKALGSICNIWQYSILAKIRSFWQSFEQIGVKFLEISRSKESSPSIFASAKTLRILVKSKNAFCKKIL